MAVTVTELTSNSSTSNTTNYATAAINPTANTLVLLAVHTTRGSSTDPVVPTVATAGGLTWVEVGNILTQDSGTLRGRFTLFRAMASSPSSSAVTIQHSATMTGCMWSITQWDGVDTGGTNGSAAVAEAVFNRVDASTTLTCTLTGVTSGNVVYSASGFLGTQTWEEEGGWTELPATEVSIATPDAKLGGAYLLADTDATHTATLSSGNDIGGAIVEIQAAAGGPTTHFGSSTVPLVFGFVSNAVRTRYGSSTVPLVFGLATNGIRKAFGASTTPIVFGFATNGVRTRYASSTVPIVFGFSTNGVIVPPGPVTHFGSSTQDIVFGFVTNGTRTTYSATAQTLVFGFATDSLFVALPSSDVPVVFGIVSNAVVFGDTVYVSVPFGPPSPRGGMIQGSPNGGTGEGSPAPGQETGTPAGAVYGPPSPTRG